MMTDNSFKPTPSARLNSGVRPHSNMAFFMVRLIGRGISYPSSSGGDPLIGFFTTRLVTAPDRESAHHLAREAVLAEWRPGGSYAEGNAGNLPDLVIDESWPIGLLSGIFSRRPIGYSFYAHDD